MVWLFGGRERLNEGCKGLKGLEVGADAEVGVWKLWFEFEEGVGEVVGVGAEIEE